MDADTRTLIERTRQRREILNQRFAGLPEAAPRKRRTPVLENDGSEKVVTSVDPDDSPKRPCLRDVELNVKQDTPAIRGVQSRIKELVSDDKKGNGSENKCEDTPTPKPRKSVSSPPLERKCGLTPSTAASSTRKNRFAALAQSINDWEDDLSHHVIHKEEEKKPRWQPPAKTDGTPGSSTKNPATSDPEAKATASPLKEARTAVQKSSNAASPSKASGSSLAKTVQAHSTAVLSSPKKTHAPPAPRDKATNSPVPALSRNSPLRTSKVEWNRSPKPFSPAYMENAVSPSKAVIKSVTPVLASPKASTTASPTKRTNTPSVNASKKFTPLPQMPSSIPVNAPGLNETPPSRDRNRTLDEPTLRPVSQRFATWAKKVESPEPSRQPVSAKLANFEQKILQNTPRLGMAESLPLPKTPKQVLASTLSASTPTVPRSTIAGVTPSVPTSASAKISDPSELPVSQRMSQMQEKLSKKHQEEPTAYSVGARMSAWEDMTSANKVSDVKKVDPSQSTPYGGSKTRPASAFTPKSACGAPGVTPKSVSAPSEIISGIAQNPPPPPALPTKTTVAPSKSFKESIEEKAAEVSNRTGLQYTRRSPVKPVSAKSVGSPQAVTHSPNKVSSGTKGVQQLLAERCQQSTTTCSQMAAQSRAARAAELASLSNRFKNGILREDTGASSSDEAVPPSEQAQEQEARVEALTPGKDPQQVKTPASTRRDAVRNKARADFNTKLAEIGLDGAEASGPSQKSQSTTASIYNLIKKREEATPSRSEENKKVKFNDSFDDSDDDSSRKIPKSAAKRLAKTTSTESAESEDKEVVFKKPAAQSNRESMDCGEETVSDSGSNDRNVFEVSDDDISLRGFVSEAVRRESIFGRPQPEQDRASSSSLDSYADSDRATVDSEEGLRQGPAAASSSRRGGYQPDMESMGDEDEDESMEEDSNKRKAVSDLLDDAFDDTIDEYHPDMDPNNVVMRKKQPRKQEQQEDGYDPDMDINNVVMRKKSRPTQQSYSNSMESTDDEDDNRPYSLQAYRKSATIHQHMMAPVVRSSKYVGKQIEEEDIPMPYAPTAKPRVDDRRAIQERIKELKELVQQEQSVIMQTSNALNKCCVGNPIFAGSSEQVECNRVLLLACQKRQCYMTEIERLKATGQLSHEGPGPQGSLTISDIRLPLKRDFVTKIGTSHDTTTHYFILLIRNASHLICTQMLSTHDPMMRGSLDFPNLIKINGITGSFKLTLDIYGMSVSREAIGKDKKKKTPKKHRGLALESPGGPSAVRTTSFSHVTSLELTKKSLDKSSFHLERLSYLSPLYGQIYMRLKCLMESNVEERGFLTMFDDVSGFGAWHRRWCVLTGNRLCIWKYPDDETRKDPMAVIDLKRCVSEKVGLVSRDICARPNTFEMVTVRQPLKGEHDTLVTRTYNATTSVKHLMSADSKEERIVWCNKINRTLANLRTWNADALKPMRPPVPHNGASSSSRR